MNNIKHNLAITLAVLVSGFLFSCSVYAEENVDFDTQIRPLLKANCSRCHTPPKRKGGFSMNTREDLLKGGESGPAVKPGEPDKSLLIESITEPDPEFRMPPEKPPLADKEIALLKRWIAEGAEWRDGFKFSNPLRAPLKPRQPKLPASDEANPIDRFIDKYFTTTEQKFGERVSDTLFIRRASLDILGLLPTPEQVETFKADTRPDKRARLIDRLLENDKGYAEHWMTFWNDALRNDYRGTGYIDGGRKQITQWLYTALYKNIPYDQFVRDLLTPAPGAEGFLKGIKWRGVVNASQRPEMQAAQNISQVFLGINLKCASCHDSFVNDWTLETAYEFASVFSAKPLEINRCNKPTGKFANPGFLFPELGEIDEKLSVPERQKQLAKLVTSKENGRLTRTMVNRLWAHFFGRGIISPTDEMDLPPFDADLLDFLAEDLRLNGYDLKHTIRMICNSRTYQMIKVGHPEKEPEPFVFRGPRVKRMTSEQFVDAVSASTGQWQRVTQQMLKADGRSQGGQLTAVRNALLSLRDGSKPVEDVKPVWLWSHPGAAKSDKGGRIYLRREFELTDAPEKVLAAVTVDNEFIMYVNGKKVTESENWTQPKVVDITSDLKKGFNLIAVEAANWPDIANKKGLQHKDPNPAGFIFVAHGKLKDKTPITINSDANWIVTTKRIDGWNQPDFKTNNWQHASVTSNNTPASWQNAVNQVTSDAPANPTKVRAVLADNNELLRALGRPNREQVTTRRETLATTFEALALTNGDTLDALLNTGAKYWLKRYPKNTAELSRQIYLTTLGRGPSDEELKIAVDYLGDAPKEHDVADLLWSIFMLPEFQLVH